jgi:hypothetical protein
METTIGPLVILNISEHFYRNPNIIGVLVGHTTTNLVQITNSFDMLPLSDPKCAEHYEAKIEQFRTWNIEPIGLYSLDGITPEISSFMKERELNFHFSFRTLKLHEILGGNVSIADYKVENEDTQRITIQEFLNNDPNPMKRNFKVLRNAFLMLRRRLAVIQEFLKTCDDYEIQLAVKSLLGKYKTLSLEVMGKSVNDVHLVQVIGKMNVACDALMQVI